MIGEILREKRISDGLSIAAMAKKIGVTRQYLSKVELGEKNPKHKKAINKLSSAYGVDKKILVDEIARMMMEE